jgi:hypothetical protein
MRQNPGVNAGANIPAAHRFAYFAVGGGNELGKLILKHSQMA